MKARNKLFRGICSFVFAISVCGGISSQASAVSAPVAGKTAYIAGDQLWLSNADGTNAQQLTSDEARYMSPALSPDGTKIAVERRVGEDKSRIYIVATDGSGMSLLSSMYRDYLELGAIYEYVGDQFRPKWNPSGTRVAFYSTEFVQEGGDPYRIYDAPLGGQGSEYGNGYNPEYSPDGSKLAYISWEPIGNTDWWRLRSVNLTAKTILEVYRSMYVIESFTWSPTTEQIALTEARTEVTAGIVLVDTTKDHSQQVVDFYSDEVYTYMQDIAWSPDGNELALVGQKNDLVSNVLVFVLQTMSFVPVTNNESPTTAMRTPLWDTLSKYLLVTYSDFEAVSTQLAVVSRLTGEFYMLQQSDQDEPMQRGVKDWQARYFVPAMPQVLGSSTTVPSGSTASAPAVLAATTLPNTGIQQVSMVGGIVPVLLMSVGGILVVAPYVYEKRNAKTILRIVAIALIAVGVGMIMYSRFTRIAVVPYTKATRALANNELPNEQKPTVQEVTKHTNEKKEYPRKLVISKLGIAARIIPLKVDKKGVIESPANIFDVGWLSSTATQQQKEGFMVMDGHVQGQTSQGVFLG